MEFYKASGRYNPSTLLIGFAMVTILALLAWPYQLILDWMPFIYVNFLLTIGFAVAVGWVVLVGFKFTKCRSRVVAIALGVTVALSAVWASHYWAYVRWTDWVATAEQVQQEYEGVDGSLLRTQMSLNDFLPVRAEAGREIRLKRTRVPITGIGVYTYWLIEAGMIVAGGFLGASQCARDAFCESCNEWCDREEVGVTIDGIGRDVVHRIAEAESLEQLLSIGPGGDRSSPHKLHYKVLLCRTCSGSAYLTIEHEERTFEDDKEKLVKRDLFSSIRLGKKEVKAMRGFKKVVEGAVTR